MDCSTSQQNRGMILILCFPIIVCNIKLAKDREIGCVSQKRKKRDRGPI